MSTEEPGDLTSHVLEEIRDELRGHTKLLQSHTEILQSHTEILQSHTEILARHTRQFEVMGERMLVIETTMRDLAEQMVMLVHAVRTTIQSRSVQEGRLDEHERRIAKLEALVHSPG